MNTQEQWKDIPGYEGYYMVSNFGRVKALRRKKATRWGGFFWIRETIKNPYPQADGYLQIGLSKDGVKSSFLLHRLVGLAFIPGDTSLEINHKDFNRKNCHADNLEWATRLDNIEYSFVNKRYEKKHERGLTKLMPKDIAEIRRVGNSVPHRVLAEKFGVSCMNIGCVINRRTWKSVA